MPALDRLAGPLLRLMDPERAHDLTLWALERGLGGRAGPADRPSLATSCFGLSFPNPLGLAAGFDKNARVPDRILELGFGFAEVGTVTPRPQRGNPKPRVFRLPGNEAVINRLGFNNDGMAVVAERLARRKGRPGIVGVNIGMNRDSGDAVGDYRSAFLALGALADFVVVNVSSPNTPGLRDLQTARNLETLCAGLARVRGTCDRHVPLLLKLAPDLAVADAVDAARTAADHGLDGLVISNTTVARPPGLAGPHAGEPGGLSGRPLFDGSTALLRGVFRALDGALPIIGVGGVASADDAYAKIRAGASLVQLYTALAYRGGRVAGHILDGLQERLSDAGIPRVAEAVGADA